MAITIERLHALPIEVRVALVASIVEEVLELYSPYFRTKYKQDEAVELAWDFALGRPVPDMQPYELASEIGDLVEQGDREGYSFSEIGMSSLMLEETYTNEGKSAFASIEHASMAYAMRTTEIQGISGMLPVTFLDRVAEPVLNLADSILSYLEKAMPHTVHRQMFDEFQLVHEHWTYDVAMTFPLNAGEVFIGSSAPHER